MAQTPWGELPINDAHVHFFSHNFYASLARAKGLPHVEALQAVLDWELPASDPTALANRWVAEMDRHGTRRACLIASVPGDEASVAAAVAAYRDRFFGYFMLDPTQPDALQRAEAAAHNPNLHGICLFPAMHKFSLADDRFTPILELASQYRMVVFVHCGALSVGVRQRLGLASLFDMRFSNPIDLHSVALRFPQIRFVIPHFGAGLLRETLMVADLCSNVYVDTSSSNRWMQYEGLNLVSVFRRVIDVLGPGRLLFGTDSSFFPRGWHAEILWQQSSALYEIGLNREQAEQIFCHNLEGVLAPRLQVIRSL